MELSSKVTLLACEEHYQIILSSQETLSSVFHTELITTHQTNQFKQSQKQN